VGGVVSVQGLDQAGIANQGFYFSISSTNSRLGELNLKLYALGHT